MTAHRAAEIAVIVEDAHRRRAPERAACAICRAVQALAFREIVATVLVENAPMLRMLDTFELDRSAAWTKGVLTLRAPLPEAGRPSPRRITAPSFVRQAPAWAPLPGWFTMRRQAVPRFGPRAPWSA